VLHQERQGLAPQDITGDHPAPAVGQGLADLVGLEVGPGGLALELGLDLLLAGLEALGPGDRLQDQLGLDGPLGLGAQVGLDLLLGLAEGLQVLLQAGPHVAQLLGEAVGPVVELVVDQGLGQGDLDLVEVGLEDPGLELALPLGLGGLLEALAQVGPELVQGVEKVTSRPASSSPASSGRVALNLRMSPLRLPVSSSSSLGTTVPEPTS
jgi:hypothetical protein